MQVGDEHDRGIDAAAHEAPFKGVTLELMEPHRDARKGSPEARQKRWQEVARNGVTDGDVDGTVNLRSPAMRPPRRIRNAGLDGAGALQELLSLEWSVTPFGIARSNSFRRVRLRSAFDARWPIEVADTSAAPETVRFGGRMK
jgi:hypothetical protein